MKKGIDISVHNGSIDWKKVSTQVDFAILRAGFGKVKSQKDKNFERNYKGCIDNGIPVGIYWYSYATTTAEAKLEAECCLAIIGNKKLDYPIWYDIEEQATLRTGKINVSNIAKTFLDIVEAKGYKVGIYSMKSGLDSYFTDAVKKKYDVWVAHVGKNGAPLSSTTYKGHEMWQYSWTGKINGISGNVDMNYCYKDYTNGGKNNKETDNVSIYYNAYTTKWLGEVKDYNNSNINGYAGIENQPIYGLSAKVSKGTLSYRVHVKGGNWLGWISTYNINDWDKGVAGIKGKAIDGVQFSLNLKDYQVYYRVSTIESKSYLPWVCGYNSTPNGYGGIFGKAIDKIQIDIRKIKY